MSATVEPTPTVPAEVQAQAIGFWDAMQRTIAGLSKEVTMEYTSKERLRQIALLALMQLAAMAAAAQTEEQAQQAEQAEQPESRILTPDTRLVLP